MEQEIKGRASEVEANFAKSERNITSMIDMYKYLYEYFSNSIEIGNINMNIFI